MPRLITWVVPEVMRPSLPLSMRADLLMCTAEERVGCAADLQAALLGGGADRLALFQRQHERLLGIGVLAGRQRIHRHLVVGRRDGQVDDHVDLAVLEQFVRRLGPDAELLGALLRASGMMSATALTSSPLNSGARRR
jgi:hypothetical protein